MNDSPVGALNATFATQQEVIRANGTPDSGRNWMSWRSMLAWLLIDRSQAVLGDRVPR